MDIHRYSRYTWIFMDIHGYSWIFIDMWNMDIKCHQSFTSMLQSSVSYTSACLLLTLMIEPKRLVRPNGLCDTPWLSGRSKLLQLAPHNSDECQARCAKGQNSGLFSKRCFRQSFLALQNILLLRKKIIQRVLDSSLFSSYPFLSSVEE